jgi:hypothetical protein
VICAANKRYTWVTEANEEWDWMGAGEEDSEGRVYAKLFCDFFSCETIPHDVFFTGDVTSGVNRYIKAGCREGVNNVSTACYCGRHSVFQSPFKG